MADGQGALRQMRLVVELADIGEVEVGRRVSPHARVAFEVVDAEAITRDLVAHGARADRAPDADALAVAQRPALRPGWTAADRVRAARARMTERPPGPVVR